MDNTYLRFTNDISADMKKGYSYLKTPTMKKAVKLNGLCAFSFSITRPDYEDGGREVEMTKQELLEVIEMYRVNTWYLSDMPYAVIVEGRYLGNNPNSEGVIIKAEKVLMEFSL